MRKLNKLNNAIVYFGRLRNNEVAIQISEEDIILGLTKIDCIECDATGKVSIPDGEIGITYSKENPCPEKICKCVVCKGTGKILINC